MTEETKNLSKNLSAKESDVIILLFGLDGWPKSSEEIAALYGTDKDTVLQIAGQALQKIPVSAEELKAMGQKSIEELRNRIAQRKPHSYLSSQDKDLLNAIIEGSAK